jgi:hypothetical protein
MKKQALLVVGLAAVLSVACGSKTTPGTAPDGAADVARGTGGNLGPDAPSQGGSGPMGSGGLATGSGGFADGATHSGGVGGRTGTGGIGGSGGQDIDAALAVDAVALDGAPQLDGTTAGDAAIDVVAPGCTTAGGLCTQLVNGCATCPSGSAPTASRLNCPSQWWCCSPLPSLTDECWRKGGMCIPGLESICPPGWTDDWTSCRLTTSKCCMPNPEACSTAPKNPH